MGIDNRSWHVIRDWARLSGYGRFEGVVALILRFVVGLVIAVALCRVTARVVSGLLFGVLDPLEHTAFQLVFGEIMTLLIALEFNHTLHYVVVHEQGLIQAKTVILIALLALARKVIILDLHNTSPQQMFGLASLTLALAIAYWLMREREDSPESSASGGDLPSTSRPL
jgi:uncharacterized membrane protein (DUF373 family)